MSISNCRLTRGGHSGLTTTDRGEESLVRLCRCWYWDIIGMDRVTRSSEDVRIGKMEATLPVK